MKKFRVSISSRLLASFLLLTIASFIIVGAISFQSMAQISNTAKQSSHELGEIAANGSAAALKVLAEQSIRQKSYDVSRQVHIYLESHPEKTYEDLCLDGMLSEIAVQPISVYGSTALYDSETATVMFHSNPDMKGTDVTTYCTKFPACWSILAKSFEGKTIGGYYWWEDMLGDKGYKYMYAVPILDTRYVVVGSAYIDEFLEPSEQLKDSIIAVSELSISEIEEQRVTTQYAFIFTILALCIVIGVLAFFLSRSFTKPILALTRGSQEIGKGNLSHRVRITTGDELEELANQFNTMASRLGNSYSVLEQKVEERTRSERRRANQLLAINDFSRRINSLMKVNELLPYIATTFLETFDYSYVNIMLLDEESGELVLRVSASSENLVQADLHDILRGGIVNDVVRTGTAQLVNDVLQHPHHINLPNMMDTRSQMSVPIKLASEIKGVFDVRSNRTNAFDRLDLYSAETVADEISITLENSRLYEEVQDLAVLEERNRMAREIHDTLAQGFTGIVLQLEAAEQALEENPGSITKHLDSARKLARESLNEARRSVWALRPQNLEKLPLFETLRQSIRMFATNTGINSSFNIEGKRRHLSEHVEDGLFRIFQEALNNAAKYSQATEVRARLEFTLNTVELSIQDNGCGFDITKPSNGGFGLISMRGRARRLGGITEIHSSPGKGTLVEVIIPQ